MKKIISYLSVATAMIAVAFMTQSCSGNVNEQDDKIDYTTTFVIYGLSGELTATFTDGGTAQFVLNGDGTVSVEYSSLIENLVVYSISSETIGKVLIGRGANETVTLKFADNSLVLREPNEEIIPIGTYSEFALIGCGAESMGIKYALEANLDMLGSDKLTAVGLERQNWTPIGYYDVRELFPNEENSFRGYFDGKGFSLSNLFIDWDTEGVSSGLFGYIDWGATLSDIHIVSGSVSGTHFVGALCGIVFFDSTISRCSNMADVVGIGGDFQSYVGGVGGICGNNYGGAVVACINSGEVNATGIYNGESLGGSHIGGVVGYNYGFNMIGLESCYNMGNVSGSEAVGGIAGQNESIVAHSYNVGIVSATGAGLNIGGAIGINAYGTVTDCYWLQYNVEEYGIGGITPLSSTQTEANPTNENARAFSATTWPSEWVVGDGATGYWKSLGSYTAGGTPEGAGSTFPALWWE